MKSRVSIVKASKDESLLRGSALLAGGQDLDEAEDRLQNEIVYVALNLAYLPDE